MQYLSRLKSTLCYKQLLNNWFLVAVVLVLVLIALSSPIFWIGVCFILYRLYQKEKALFHITWMISAFFCLHYLVVTSSYQTITTGEFMGVVVEKKIGEYSNRYLVKSNGKKVYIRDNSEIEYNIGDMLKVEGTVQNINGATIPGAFDYQDYCKKRQISGIIVATTIEKTGHQFHPASIQTRLVELIEERHSKEGALILCALILGNKEAMESSTLTSMQKVGILHLFAISGTHIAFFIVFLSNILSFLGIKRKEEVLLIFLGLYMVITNFQISILRAGFGYLFAVVNKKCSFGLSSLDCLSILFILFLLINPMIQYQIGFQLTFLIAALILLLSGIIKDNPKHITLFIISLGAIVISLPITSNMQTEINGLSPFLNVVYLYWMEWMMLPFSFIVLFFPILIPIYDAMATMFLDLTMLFSTYAYIPIFITPFTTLASVVYYVSLFGLIGAWKKKTKKTIVIALYVLLVGGITNTIRIDPYQKVYFFDVINGESILIKDRFNQCNFLIDTGDGRGGEITNFLKRNNIQRLDYVLITHHHLDHYGEIEHLNNHIQIDTILSGPYDEGIYQYWKNHQTLTTDEYLVCGTIPMFLMVPTTNYNDVNDNSVALHTTIGGLQFLFLGDLTKAGEERLLTYNIKADIIKVAHHGSKTSTSIQFLQQVRPTTAIIQTGHLEKFGFPHQETLTTLGMFSIHVHITKYDATIVYVVGFGNRYILETGTKKRRYV